MTLQGPFRVHSPDYSGVFTTRSPLSAAPSQPLVFMAVRLNVFAPVAMARFAVWNVTGGTVRSTIVSDYLPACPLLHVLSFWSSRVMESMPCAVSPSAKCSCF